MALALEQENAVWQKVHKVLGNQSGGAVTGTAANPISQNASRALKLQLATQKLAPQLQFVPFSYANITGATGYQPGIAGAFTLYGVYAHKSGTGTTGAYLHVDDAASGTPTATRVCTYLKTTLDEFFWVSPGIAFATDVTIGVWSTNTGTTAITGAGDVIQGFLIIGA